MRVTVCVMQQRDRGGGNHDTTAQLRKGVELCLQGLSMVEKSKLYLADIFLGNNATGYCFTLKTSQKTTLKHKTFDYKFVIDNMVAQVQKCKSVKLHVFIALSRYHKANMDCEVGNTANVSSFIMFVSLPGIQCHEPDSGSKAGGSDAHVPSVKVS